MPQLDLPERLPGDVRLPVRRARNGRAPLVRWTTATVVGACLLASGCEATRLNLRGEGFQENEMSEFCREYRSGNGSTGRAGLSEKSTQIEHSLGY